jgi:Bacterial capsule synthesis protein PGA_cap
MAKDEIVLLACGDVGPLHGDMGAYGAFVRPVLAAADIRFAQCERHYSDRHDNAPAGVRELSQGHHTLPPHMMSVFTDNAFNVVSLAGNHTMEYGDEPALDTVALFNKQGMQTIGCGRNIEEARRPAVFEKHGVRVAMLAYCSVMRDGQQAGVNKAGIAPLRVRTSYEPYEYQAGVPPRVITVPYEEDVAAMVDDIAKAKTSAHAVVVSVHWGVHYIPRLIAEYQPIIARAAVAAGADLIVGHHPHVPKAIEMINGKACFYSLGNFMFTTDGGLKPTWAGAMKRYGVISDFAEYPQCPHGKDSKHSLIAKAVITRDGIKQVSFLPVQIDKLLRPEVLKRSDPRFDTVMNYLDWASEDYPHRFTVEGEEVVCNQLDT